MKPLSTVATSAMPEVANDRRFIVGSDAQGHWLAVEQHGLGGGIFTSQDAALRYAAAECDRRPGGVQLVPRATISLQ